MPLTLSLCFVCDLGWMVHRAVCWQCKVVEVLLFYALIEPRKAILGGQWSARVIPICWSWLCCLLFPCLESTCRGSTFNAEKCKIPDFLLSSKSSFLSQDVLDNTPMPPPVQWLVWPFFLPGKTRLPSHFQLNANVSPVCCSRLFLHLTNVGPEGCVRTWQNPEMTHGYEVHPKNGRKKENKRQ